MAMTRQNVEDLYELSPLQQGMLFHFLAAPSSDVYLIRLVCSLRGPLDVAAFERAWQMVVDRNPSLRTSFHWEAISKPLQIVHRRQPSPIELHDWRDVPERAARLADYLAADAARGIRLDEAPLTRLALVRTADDRWQLIWSFPHILLEGWSAARVLNELFSVYQALRGNQTVPAPSVPRYRDYIAWLQKRDAGRAEAYWRPALSGFAAPTPLTVDRPVDGEQPEQYSRSKRRLSPQLSASLQSFARERRLTLNTVFQGAWAVLLSLYSGERDVVFGTVVSGREVEFPDIQSLIGLCVNTLPTRVRLSPEQPIEAWLQRLQVSQAAMREFEYTALIDVQRWSDVPRGTPLFESIFVFENWAAEAAPSLGGGELTVDGVESVEGGSGYPLVVEVAPGREIGIGLSYDTRRFDAESIARLLDHYETLLWQMTTRPAASLGEVSLLSPEAQRAEIDGWNDTATDYERTVCVHEAVIRQAGRTPEAIAVACGERHLTYGGLNEASDRLARHLRGLGVGPDALVGVCVERSVEMLTALLGVLRAGGAYVPLDPAFPADRLSYMLADARAPIVLVDRHTRGIVASPNARLVDVDDPASWGDGLPAEAGHDRRARPDDLAYVIYTSGSTGRPKGVQVPHRAVVNFLASMRDAAGRLGRRPAARGDDAVVRHRGARAVPAADGGRAGCARRAATTAADGALLAKLPGRGRGDGDAGDAGDVADAARRGLGRPADAVDAVRRRGAAARARQPAARPRAGRVEHVRPDRDDDLVDRGARRGRRGGRADRPADRQHAALRARRPAPAAAAVGVPGELYIGGDGLARGYLGAARADRRALRAGSVRRDAASGCTGRATWRAGGPTARSSSSAAPTTR